MAETETGASTRTPSPTPRIVDFPSAIWVTVVVTACIILLLAQRFDHTKGTLTLSLLVGVTFVGVVVYCLVYTIPQTEETATVIGGLVASFGAVVAYWLGRPRPPPPP
jgi:uncharacterized membrane protein